MTIQYTVNQTVSTDAQRFASYLSRLKQIANEAQNWKAEFDKIIDAGNTNVYSALQQRLGLEIGGVATDNTQTQVVYNLVLGSAQDINGTEAVPNSSRTLVTQVAAK